MNFDNTPVAEETMLPIFSVQNETIDVGGEIQEAEVVQIFFKSERASAWIPGFEWRPLTTWLHLHGWDGEEVIELIPDKEPADQLPVEIEEGHELWITATRHEGYYWVVIVPPAWTSDEPRVREIAA